MRRDTAVSEAITSSGRLREHYREETFEKRVGLDVRLSRTIEFRRKRKTADVDVPGLAFTEKLRALRTRRGA
jgi:hypothetical protein